MKSYKNYPKKHFALSIVETFGHEEIEVSFEDEVIAYTGSFSDAMEIIKEDARYRGLSKDEYDIQHNC